ncbi:LTA synthase family protein [Tessaracoccus sp. ZS01]|uniref:LTA synthase family protein n=1 Tax=Tessaracoccus sp. ZS01 TaxID=1906324 RepID=UPI0009F9A41D|nr:LTA synthase family protein [Tessaracoccus sp. ZS01]
MTVNSESTSRSPAERWPWGRLAVLMAPFAVLGVWLKVVRIDRFYPSAGLAERATKLSSDVAFGLFWCVLWAVTLLYLRRPRLRSAAVVLAQVLTAAIGVFMVVNHSYALRTGNPLTPAQIALAIREAEALSGLLGSQVDATFIGLLVGVVLWSLVAPLLLGKVFARLFTGEAGPVTRRVGLAGAVLLLIAATWTAPTASASFALSPAVQLAVSPIKEAAAYPEAFASGAPLADPESTRLVPRPGERHRNVVVITLESQRATSALPETRQPVTPVLDALAEQSVRPERGYTVLPHTSKSLVSIHCGMAPPPDNRNTEADENGLPQRCLPELLADEGYSTAFFQSATEHFERRRGTAANLGFQKFTPVDGMDKTGFSKANYFGYEDDIMLEPVRRWLKRQDGPFMLGMLTVTAHHDYNVPGYELIDFVDRPLMNKYLNAVHLQDRFVGHVIDLFKELGLYEDTVFVISGDHGEGFGEHQLYQHDNTIYEEGIRVPMLVHDPRRAPELIEGPANQLALMPTAVDALGFDLVSDVEYRPSLYSGEPQGPVIVSCWVRGRCTAVLDGDRKLIHHFGDRRDEVFNVAEDPGELTDLVTGTDADWMERGRELAVGWYLDVERWYAPEE